MKKEALEAIKQKFGDRASTAEREILVYSHDIIALPSSLMFNFKADAVVRVKTVEEVVGLMQTCQEYKLPITPRGASTSGYGGVLPTKGGVMCDLSGMNKIIGLDESNLNVTVEPGVVWKDLDDFLLKWGYTLCSYPTSALSSTVGGWAAEGGIGVGSTRYGGIENQVTELEIVLPNGHVFNTVKDSPTELGLENKNEVVDLFVGSYGILGIVTKITLKVRPGEETLPICATFTRLKDAIKAIKGIIKRAKPYHINLADKNFQALRTSYGEQCAIENTLCIFFTGLSAKENIKTATKIIERNGGSLQDQKIAEKEWEDRLYPLRIKRLGPSLVPSQTIVPIEALPAFIRRVQKKYSKEKFGVECSFTSTEAAPLFYFLGDERIEASFLSTWSRSVEIQQHAIDIGGKPYGIGLWNTGYLQKAISEDRIQKMKALKTKFDKNSILNPNKMFEAKEEEQKVRVRRHSLFLSPEWIHEVTKVVQGTIAKDKDLRKLTSGYSLNLAYAFTELPLKLGELYSNEHQLVLFVRLEKGRIKKLEIRTELPEEKVDFTISSDYSVVNKIFQGNLNPATAFINRQLKVEPRNRIYRRPKFTAKSIVIANMLLKIAMQVPTKFADREEPEKTVITPLAGSA